MIFDALKHQWQLLRSDPPGERFERLYQRCRDQRARGGAARYLLPGASIVLILIGLVLLVVPGPGIPFLVGGVALLAAESHRVARTIDAAELKLRAWYQKLLGRPAPK